MPIDLESLRLLAAVARTGSISRAAAERSLSQPSASARLARLERETGLALLRKTPRGSALTHTGRRFLAEAEAVLRAAERLEALAEGLRGRSRAELRVAASYTIAEYLVQGWLGAAGLPADTEVGVEVGNSLLVCDLVSRGVAAVGFVEAPRVPDDLDSEVVARDELVLVVDPSHPWARRGTIDPDRLTEQRLVTREPGSGTRDYAEARLADLLERPLPAPSRVLGSTTAVKAAVEAGSGPALLSRLAVERELAEGRLVAVEVEGLDLRRDLRAVVSRGVRPTGAVRELIEAARTLGAAQRSSGSSSK